MFIRERGPRHGPRQWKTALLRRQYSGLSNRTEGVIILAVVLGLFLCGGLASFLLLRFLRARHQNPRYIPGSWLKAKWEAWTPSAAKKRKSTLLQNRRSTQMASMPVVDGEEGQAAVDRNTSVRSTITLPAYSAAARPTERILGREGERAGVDTVLEYPETAEEEEARRDGEMETLYQIRRTRREEREEREERRRLRREARDRRDAETLAALRIQALAAREQSADRSSAALIADHQGRERGRRVSTVEYMDLGVARHDGSRVRANSNDSDRPLLGAAAAIGGGGVFDEMRPRSGSSNTLSVFARPHFRNASTSSLRFMTHDHSDDEQDSDMEIAGTPMQSSTPSRSRAGTIPGEYGSQAEPPQYDEVALDDAESGLLAVPRPPELLVRRAPEGEAPPYEPPSSGAPRLPAFAPLPSIEITLTPWHSVPG